MDTDRGVLIYESYGRCSSNHLAYWAGPILALHILVMVITNYLLYNIRNVSDRYQESKYVGFASAYACEFLIIGIPILIAVGENAVAASYIVLVCIVGLGDLGILGLIFVPKVLFSWEGLPEGVSVGQSIFKTRAAGQVSDRRQEDSPDAVESNKSAIEEMQEIKTTDEASLEMIVREGVNSKPPSSTEAREKDSKKQEEGALVNNLTLQW